MAFVEIDMENGSLWDNLELSHPYRQETREYIRYCLELKSDSSLDPVKSENATIQAFETVGTAIRKAYNYGQSTPGPMNMLFAMASFD